MTREPADRPQAADDAATEAALNALGAWTASDDFDLPDGAVVHAPAGPEAGRAFLEQFVSAGELDKVSRAGRPSLSGKGTSPKRQVRLPADLDAQLVRLAKDKGRTPSDVMREAVETYIQSA
ncbi:ribbon-helix-helix protein, CopG family [Cellulomonas sp. NPDC055163]